jgi:hypothetical protein
LQTILGQALYFIAKLTLSYIARNYIGFI